jgi:hypothetical protein
VPVPPPAVVIEIAPAQAASPYAPALVAACSEGVRLAGGCALEQDAETASPAAVAIVAWSGADRLGARVEVGTRGGDRASWHVREVTFSAQDREIERWRAIGFVVATLVGEALPPPEPAPVAETPAAPPAPTPQPPSAPPPAHAVASPPPVAPPVATFRPRPLWIDVGALAQRGSEPGSPAAGISLRAHRRLTAPWTLTSAFAYAAEPSTPAGVSLESATASAGVGASAFVAPARVVFELHLEAVGTFVAATAVDAATGASDHAARIVPGAREGASIAWMAGDALGIVAGADASEVASGTLVRVAGEGVTRLAPFGWSVTLGARLALE